MSHLQHDPGGVFSDGNPSMIYEVPQRADIILAALQEAGVGPAFQATDHRIEPILAVHDAGLVNYLQMIYSQMKNYRNFAAPVYPSTFSSRSPQRKSIHPEALPGYYCFGTATPVLEGTWQAAYWSAQCALEAAEMLFKSHCSSYAICRPPGHHAGRDYYGGYCYLNNAAIATRYLLQIPNAPSQNRIAILDIDYHHGNGTQDIFYDDDRVLYCSLHADPDQDYPYFWGSVGELGEGPGYGYNRNYPLPKGTTDRQYYNTLIMALDAITKFSPTYLVVSAGYDIGEDDPEGGFKISADGFYTIGKSIHSTGIPALIIQEGGYHLKNLSVWCRAFVAGFQ